MKIDTKIVFLQDKLFVGGIEILEMKLVEELSRRGYAVVVCARDHEMLGSLPSGAVAFRHTGYPDFIRRCAALKSDATRRIIFVSLHPNAAAAAEIAGRKLSRQHGSALAVHHFHWVSHSRAFFFSQRSAPRRLLRACFGLLPVQSTYFMNDAALLAHQAFWRRSLENYPVLRIIGRSARAHAPRGTHDQGEGRTASRPLRIVSVGRLVPFKSYNLHAPEIVRLLVEAGIDATWDIWGYGPEEAAIRSRCTECGVADRVRLRGSLPHDDFDATVVTYDVFVGMGTSILEAAKTQTPSCLAIEAGHDTCYGFLHEAPRDSVGDRVEGVPTQTLFDALNRFARLSPAARSDIGRRDATTAAARESTLGEFVEAILSARAMRKLSWRESAVLPLLEAYLAALHVRRRGSSR